MQKKIITILAFVGIILFIYILYKIDPFVIWQTIKRVTWSKFLLLILMRLIYWCLRTVNWKIILSKYEIKTSFLQSFRARLAGHAIGYLTPSAKFGGEAVRVLMLKKENKKKILASVIIDKTIELMSTVLFAFIGVIVAVITIYMSNTLRVMLIFSAVVSIVFFAFIFKKQKNGFFLWLIDSMKKIKIRFKFLERNREKIKETDVYISSFYNENKKTFLYIFILYTVEMIIWTTEIYLTFLFIGAGNVTFLKCFLIISLGTIAFILPAVPAAIGIYEMTYLGIFSLLRIKIDFGLSFILIRRILGLMWAGIGLFHMIQNKRAKNL